MPNQETHSWSDQALALGRRTCSGGIDAFHQAEEYVSHHKALSAAAGAVAVIGAISLSVATRGKSTESAELAEEALALSAKKGSAAVSLSRALTEAAVPRLGATEFLVGGADGVADVGGVRGVEGASNLSTLVHAHESRMVSTADLAGRLTQFPSAHEFRELLDGRTVGEIPESIVGSGTSQSEAATQLDKLARVLRSVDVNLPPGKKMGLGAKDLGLPKFGIHIGTETVDVQKVGVGEVAHVYKLSGEGESLALKVPNDPVRMDVHGTYAETGAYTFFSKGAGVSDLSTFHAANPSNSGGWMLTEFVENPAVRSGVPINQAMAANKLILGDTWGGADSWGPNRGPGNTVWDVGGIEPAGVSSPSTLTEFKALFDTRDGQILAGRRLSGLRDQGDLKSAMMLILDHNGPAVGQVARGAVRFLKDPRDVSDVLSKALEVPGAAGRAAFELDRLQGTPYMSNLFFKALDNPESRIAAVQQIDKLSADQVRPAIYSAFRYPEARPMATRMIPALTEQVDRVQARSLAATDAGSRFVMLKTQVKDLGLTLEQAQIQAAEAFEQYLKSFGLL